MRDGVTVGAQGLHEFGQQRESVRERREIRDLAADMHVDAADVHALELRGMRIDGARAADRNAEFVFGFSGRDLGMRARIDIGIDAHRNVDAAPLRCGDVGQAVEFRFGFDIDAENAGIDGEREFAVGLADAGEHDLVGGNSGRERALQFAFGDDIGAGTEPRERRDHRLIGIRLDRVADERRHIGERVGEYAVMALQGR